MNLYKKSAVLFGRQTKKKRPCRRNANKKALSPPWIGGKTLYLLCVCVFAGGSKLGREESVVFNAKPEKLRLFQNAAGNSPSFFSDKELAVIFNIKNINLEVLFAYRFLEFRLDRHPFYRGF